MPPTVARTFYINSSEDNHSQICPQVSVIWAISQLRSLSQMTRVNVKLTIKSKIQYASMPHPRQIKDNTQFILSTNAYIVYFQIHTPWILSLSTIVLVESPVNYESNITKFSTLDIDVTSERTAGSVIETNNTF